MLAAADVHAPGYVRGAAAWGILRRARRAGRRRDAPCAEGAGCRWATGIHHFAGKGNSPRKDGNSEFESRMESMVLSGGAYAPLHRFL